MVARAELAELFPACLTNDELCEEETLKLVGDDALQEAERLVQETNLAETPEGRFGLQYVLAQVAVVRPILRSPSQLLASSLSRECGGEAYNPHRRIDELGGWLVRRMVGRNAIPIHLYIEETGWEAHHTNGRESLRVIVDSIDGTNGLVDGNKEQATGIVIAGPDDGFRAGAIASLVDTELALIEGGSAKILNFDSQKDELSGPLLPPRKQRDVKQARFAVLGRRMELLQTTKLFKERPCPNLLTFGGYGLLCVLRGQEDGLLDPFKGQPWREAVLWGWMAQEAGLVVTDEKGRPIDFSQVLRRAHQRFMLGQEEELFRVKMVITTHQELHNQVLKGLRPRVEEAVLQEEIVYQLAA